MILSEEHRIKVRKNKDLGSEIDIYCYLVKNLSNAVNYLIRQCYRIHTKLKSGNELEEWEQDMLDAVNDGIRRYNCSRPGKKELRYVDAENSFIADAYFLSWYLKGTSEYKAVTSSAGILKVLPSTRLSPMLPAARSVSRRNAGSGSLSTIQLQSI